MSNNSDNKLLHTARVVLKRLSETETRLFSKTITSIESNEKLNNDSSKMSNKKDIKEEKDISPSFKKEKEDFGIDDGEKEKLSATVGNLNYLNCHSSYMTNKRNILESFKTPSQNLDSKNFPHKRIKLETETKYSLKGVIGSKIYDPGNVCKRSHISRNVSGSVQKIEPIIDLIPPALKSEEGLDVRTIKKTCQKDHLIVEVERKLNEKMVTFSSRNRALINKHKSATIPLPRVSNISVPEVKKKQQEFEEPRTFSLNSDSTPQRPEGFQELDLQTEPEEPRTFSLNSDSTPQRPEGFQELDLQTEPEEPRTFSLNSDSTPQRPEGFQELDLQTEPEESTPLDSTVQRPNNRPEEVLQELDIQNEPVESTNFSLNINLTTERTREGTTEVLDESDVNFSERTIISPPTTDSALSSDSAGHNVIKVKAPQALGIHFQDVLQDAQNIYTDNVLKFLPPLNQIRSLSGNESRIAEICELYPVFFTPEVRRDICELISIIYSLSAELICNDSGNEIDDSFYLLSVQNRSPEFLKIFYRVLKLDQIGGDQDLLKKIIPILYLHLENAFKRLRPAENFDFRKVMKHLFDAEHFICKYDVILDMSNEMFQKAISTFNRWLEDIFIECDISEILEPGIPVKSAVNSNYLSCPLCMKAYPICFFCKDLLGCKCSNQDDQTEVIRNVCKEHSIMDWQEVEEKRREEEAKDHDTLLNTKVCTNEPCSNKGTWLCFCKQEIYCSQSCKDEDWYDGHHKTCSLYS